MCCHSLEKNAAKFALGTESLRHATKFCYKILASLSDANGSYTYIILYNDDL